MRSKRKYFFPLHFDSGNRGCEAIARGTIEILSMQKDEYYGLCSDMELDRKVGLSDLATLLPSPGENAFFYKVRKRLIRDKEQKKMFRYHRLYNEFMDLIDKDSCMFITGGDMLCYTNNEVNYINDALAAKKRRTILWGCSVGEENLTPEKIDTLKNFSLITARESLTYQMLKEKLGLDTVQLFPDPAFVLHAEEVSLPSYFEHDCVGINLSNFVGANVAFDTDFGKNILALMKFILLETDFDIVLMPHVFWKGQDDRIICNAVYKQFEHSNRIHVLNSSNMNYGQIRYAISKCRFFIGARTHSMISAYSTCTPSLALGYSVKSRGIAKDIGLSDELVVDYRLLEFEQELQQAFQYLMEHEDMIKNHLKVVMPEYCQKAYAAKGVLEGEM